LLARVTASGEVEFGVEVDAPAAIAADAFADLFAEGGHAVDGFFKAVHDLAARVGGDAVGAEAGVDAGFGDLFGVPWVG
jgi:hypothetical protein